MGALIHNKRVLPGLPGQLVAAAKIPQSSSPIAVKLNLERHTILNMIVPGCQLCPIMGRDGHSFIRNFIHLLYE